jgi:hypothetical protein
MGVGWGTLLHKVMGYALSRTGCPTFDDFLKMDIDKRRGRAITKPGSANDGILLPRSICFSSSLAGVWVRQI